MTTSTNSTTLKRQVSGKDKTLAQALKTPKKRTSLASRLQSMQMGKC